MAAILPTAEARGAKGLAAIREPMTISVTPISCAVLFSPNFLTTDENKGLEVTRGLMFSISYFWNFSVPIQTRFVTRGDCLLNGVSGLTRWT